jgi:hypothetical protein
MSSPAREVKIRVPSDFNGERTKTTKFLQEVKLYLRVNQAIYDTDEKRIIFALSFMTGGTASAWALTKGDQLDMGTWEEFEKELLSAFSPIDDAGSARTEMKNLTQGDKLEDYVAQFIILKGRSNITEEVPLIDMFLDGLNSKLREKVFNMEVLPTTLDGMIKAASKYDGQWRRAQAIGKRMYETPKKIAPATGKTKETAIEINRLTPAERMEHMRKGLCFLCHKPGHRSSDHNKTGPVYTPTHASPYKYSPKKGADAYASIKAIMAELDEEEKGKTYRLMEESGF